MEVTYLSGRRKAPGRLQAMAAGGKPFGLELATSLRTLVFGAPSRGFTEGWIGQAFEFSNEPALRFGLVQRRGGPCGVMACVQVR